MCMMVVALGQAHSNVSQRVSHSHARAQLMEWYCLYVDVCPRCGTTPQDNEQNNYTRQSFNLIGPGTKIQPVFGELDHHREHGLVPHAEADFIAHCSAYVLFRRVGCSVTPSPSFHVGTNCTMSLKRYGAPAVHLNPFQTAGTHARRGSPTPKHTNLFFFETVNDSEDHLGQFPRCSLMVCDVSNRRFPNV